MAQIPFGEFRFPHLSSVVYGVDAVQQLGKKVDELGARHALVVANRSLANNEEIIGSIKDALRDKLAGVFSGVKPHTPRESVLEGVGLAREKKADILVSLGGGSAHDTAKGINLVLTVGEELDDYSVRRDASKTAHRLKTPILSQIAIPTTLSAAEFSERAAITDTERNHKNSFRHAQLQPKVVILDPKMAVYTPRELWASSGLKSMADSFGQFCSPRHIPFVDGLALNAITSIDTYLLRSIRDPSDLEARGMLLHVTWTSHYGGPNVGGGGMVSALRHQIGPMHKVAHAVASAIVFPHCLDFSRPAIDERLALIAKALDLLPWKTEDPAAATINRVKQLTRESGLPTRLRDVGIPREALKGIADSVIEDDSLRNDLKPIYSFQDVMDVLEAAW